MPNELKIELYVTFPNHIRYKKEDVGIKMKLTYKIN